MSVLKVFDARVVPRIKECLGSWTPPGIRPRYLSKELVSCFDTPILRGRVLFGTDYPLLEWTPSIDDILQLPIAAAAKHEILWANAARSFGLEESTP